MENEKKQEEAKEKQAEIDRIRKLEQKMVR